jgi:NagD protein
MPLLGSIERLARVRHVALDLDGTLYLGANLFAATPRFLDDLRELGITHSFLTNNSSYSRGQYVRKLAAMGISAEPEEVRISTHAAADYLHLHHPGARRLFVLGTPALQGELADLGFEVVDPEPTASALAPSAVVVGFDRTLTYDRLCRAAWWIRQGVLFIATHPDRTCPTNEATILVDCGAICAALTSATGRAPIVVGKPDARMLAGLQRTKQLAAGELAMVGDRLYTDMMLARNAGAIGVLVLTGEATLEQAQAAAAENAPHRPDLVVSDLHDLRLALRRARQGEAAP